MNALISDLLRPPKRLRTASLLSLALTMLVPIFPARGSSLDGARVEIQEPARLRLRWSRAPSAAARSFWQGRIAYLQGNFEDACESFEKALDKGVEDPAAYFWLGRAYAQQARKNLGTLRRAAAARRSRLSFEEAVRRDPEYLEARLALVSFHLVAPSLVGGNREEAQRQAREIARRDAYLGYLAWGGIYEHGERWDRAAQAYGDAQRIRPEAVDPYLRLVWMYQGRHRFQEAFGVLEKALEQAKETSLLLYELGRTAAFSGLRGEEGLAALEAYLRRPRLAGAPSRALTLSHAAMIHRHLGNNTEALRIFRQASDLDPDLPQVRRNIEDLERLISPAGE